MAAYGVDIEIGVKGQQQLQNLTREIKQAGRAADLIADSLGKKGKVSQSIDNYNSALRRASKTLGTVIAGTRAETRAVKKYAEALSDVIAIEQRRERLVKGAFRETPAGQAELELTKARKSLETQREAAKFRKDVAISEAEYYKASLESAARSNQRVNDQINLQERLNGALRQGAFEARMLSENMKQPQRMVGPVYGLRADRFTAASAAKATERLAIQQKITRLSASQVFQKNLEFALATKLLGKDKQRNLLAEQITARQKEMIRDGQALAAQKERALAAEKKSADLAAVQRKRGVGGAISSGLIGGGFPLLFGQGGAAAAGGAIGGLAGGALGGGFGFALSVIGTALGQAITNSEEFNRSIVDLNSGLDGTADNASITSSEISELATQLGLAKDETVELLSGFKNLGANTNEIKAFAQVFGDDASTIRNLAASKKLSEVGEAIFANIGKIGKDKATQLINELKIKDAQVVQLGLIEAIAKAEETREISQARQVKFTDRIVASLLMMGAGAEALAVGQSFTAEQIANDRGDKLQSKLEAARSDRIKSAAEFVKELREVFNTISGLDPEDESSSGGTKVDPTINLKKRLGILNKQIQSEEKVVGLSAEAVSIIKRKLAFEGKIAQIQETGIAERKRLTEQEDISLSKSIEKKAVDLETLKFEREITALIERQNKAGEKLLEPLQKKLDAIRDRNAFEKEYGDLIMSGSTPAAAKQVIEAKKQIKEIERLVEKQLESNKILIANLEIAVDQAQTTKARVAAEDALNRAMQRRNEIEEKGRIAKGEVKGEKTPAERFNDEIKAIQGIINELNDPVRQAIELSRTLGSAFSESFKGIVSGSMSAQQALANLFQRTADHFLDMAAQMIAAQIKMQAVNLFMSFFPGGGGGTTGLSDLNAPASINNPLGIMPKALGGPVSSGRPYLVGERGPEMFVPGAQGNIVPNNAMGGGASVTVNVDASGSSVEGDGNQAAQLGKAIGIAVQQELIKQKRPGGLLTR